MLIAHLALLGRDPHARREEILRSVESMLPHALAQIEQGAPPAASAGFERAVETVAHLARTAVRFEPGSTREVVLVPLSGKREVYGFRQGVMGRL